LTLGGFLGSLLNSLKFACGLRAVRHLASALDVSNEAVTAVFLSDFFEISGIGWTSPSVMTRLVAV
jgi:hypothetical protein